MFCISRRNMRSSSSIVGKLSLEDGWGLTTRAWLARIGALDLLVDVALDVLAAGATDAADQAGHDVIAMRLGILEAVGVADRDANDENEDELHATAPMNPRATSTVEGCSPRRRR